jgi:hypothetical protein
MIGMARIVRRHSMSGRSNPSTTIMSQVRVISPSASTDPFALVTTRCPYFAPAGLASIWRRRFLSVIRNSIHFSSLPNMFRLLLLWNKG